VAFMFRYETSITVMSALFGQATLTTVPAGKRLVVVPRWSRGATSRTADHDRAFQCGRLTVPAGRTLFRRGFPGNAAGERRPNRLPYVQSLALGLCRPWNEQTWLHIGPEASFF
jgi:hypothetical protein